MNGNRYNKIYVMEILRTACQKAGILYGDNARNSKVERIGIVFHCLRHARITKWVISGYSDEIIRMASGQKPLEAYRKYIHLDPATVMRLVDSEKKQTEQKQNKIGVRPLKSRLETVSDGHMQPSGRLALFPVQFKPVEQSHGADGRDVA